MFGNDLPDRCKPYSQTWEFCLRVQPFERYEKLAGKLHAEANTVVTHEVHVLPVLLRDVERNRCGRFSYPNRCL